MVNKPGHTTVHRDCDGLETWAVRNIMQVSKGKGKVLHLGRNNPRDRDMLGPPSWNAAWQKGLGVLVGTNFYTSLPQVLAAKNAIGILSCFSKVLPRGRESSSFSSPQHW